jgi:transcriptional regulator with XRE-family HTH domain
MDALHRTLAKRIRYLMRGKGLSLNRLADFSGVGRGRMSELLAGKSSPTVRSLGRKAEARRTSYPHPEPSPQAEWVNEVIEEHSKTQYPTCHACPGRR